VTNSESVAGWIGCEAVGQDGEKIGTVEEIYVDDVSGQPEWLAIKTGMFGSKVSFVPLADATPEGDALRVPYGKDKVKGAPQVEADGHLEPNEEAELYEYYGRTDYDSAGRAPKGERSGGKVGRDTSGPETDDAMTRSEEEVRVDKVSREAGRVRLRKYVVTEQVQMTVPVQREEVRIEREPITDANRDQAMSGADLSEEEHEVTLHQEEVTVDKNVVPKERVRLDKDVVTEDRQVSEEVRKEQVEVEGDIDSKDKRKRK
jgi:uncharacterized protein (TIGR02271 family)